LDLELVDILTGSCRTWEAALTVKVMVIAGMGCASIENAFTAREPKREEAAAGNDIGLFPLRK